MYPGKFIVIDGLDGSGKKTQADLLLERLRKDGYQVEMVDFPQYDSWSSEFVQRYLRGEFGTSKEVNPKQASYFYALDRFAASFQVKKWLQEGKIVISNRYVSANKGHQVGKVYTDEKKKEILDWINGMEYGDLGIPIPNLTLFLHMTPEIGQKLVNMKSQREYLQGKKMDIHEADINHLKDAEKAYIFCLDNDPVENWKRIVCYEANEPRTIPAIHEDVYREVISLINKNNQHHEN